MLQDLLLGLVTSGPGRDVYGVVVDRERGLVDQAATEAQRLALREARLGGKQLPAEATRRRDIPVTGWRINEYLQVAGSGDGAFVQCTWCGARLCAADAVWKDHVVARRSPPSSVGPLRANSSRVFLVEFFCPGCATALDVDVAVVGDPLLHDRIYRRAGEAGERERPAKVE